MEWYDKYETLENKKFLFKFWDTAGQEKFSVPTRNYYHIAHGVVVTVAINNRDSFLNLKKWLKNIKEKNSNENLQLMVIGSKCDLEEERVVSTEELKAQADDLKIDFFETSAKENRNIEEAFDSIIKKVYNNVYNSMNNGSKNGAIKLEENNETKPNKKGCCK